MSRNIRRRIRTAAEIFTAPFVIAAASFSGLIIALTGDGVRDALSWAALALPIAAVLWAMHNRRI